MKKRPITENNFLVIGLSILAISHILQGAFVFIHIISFTCFKNQNYKFIINNIPNQTETAYSVEPKRFKVTLKRFSPLTLPAGLRIVARSNQFGICGGAT